MRMIVHDSKIWLEWQKGQISNAKKTGEHYHSVMRARMGYNISLMLTIFFDFRAVPWPQPWTFCDLNLGFIRPPWYIKLRIEKHNFCQLVVVFRYFAINLF